MEVGMQLLLVFVLLISSVGAKIAQSDEIVSQKEMNEQAKKAYQETNNELKAIHAELNKALDVNDKNRLATVEKAWMKYRDLHCEAATHYYLQGSAFYLMKYSCLKEITAQRITTLRAAYQEQLQMKKEKQ
jgi:uncharacterized protein YecT (DUF1311 family)